MIKITRYFYIHILFVVMLLLSFIVESSKTFIMAYCIVFCHEMCHLIAAFITDTRIVRISVLPFGMELSLADNLVLYPQREIFIAASGPVCNAVLLIFAAINQGNKTESWYLFCIINMAILLINLLPIPPLDGGRIFRAVMIRRFGILKSAPWIRRIAKTILGILGLCALCCMIVLHANPGLAILCCFLLFSFIKEDRKTSLVFMRKVLYEKNLWQKQNIIPTKQICVHGEKSVKHVLKRLNFDSFYIIYILDNNSALKKIVTEQNVIRSVTQKGYNITFDEVT